MRKIILSLLAFVFLGAGSIFAQDTNPVRQTFPIRQQDTDWPINFGQSGMFDGVSLWERTDDLNLLAYTTNAAAGLDSVYFLADSISNLTGETLYRITVGGRGYGTVTNQADNGYDTDSTLSITVRKITQRSDSSATYTVWRKRANRCVINGLGFTFNSNVKNGQKYEIALTYDKPLEFKRDPLSDALEGIDETHAKVHAGRMYFVSADTSLASLNDSLKITMVTPAGGRFHLAYTVDASAKCYFVIREDVTIASGDTVTQYNADRDSSGTSSAVVQRNSLGMATTGTKLVSHIVNSSMRAGAVARGENEIILDASSKYAFVVHATAAADVTMVLRYYKED